MKTVILAGGLGSRLAEKTDKVPKPMIKIGNKPIISHIINHYAKYVISRLEPTLEEIGVDNINSCFTDDYDLYLYKYNILLINNFLGWGNLHPYLKSKKPNAIFKTSSFLKNDIPSFRYPDIISSVSV